MSHTPSPWKLYTGYLGQHKRNRLIEIQRKDGKPIVRWSGFDGVDLPKKQILSNAKLMAAAATQHEEMLRYLPILQRVEADPGLWERLTKGTGIATLNGYISAIAQADPKFSSN